MYYYLFYFKKPHSDKPKAYTKIDFDLKFEIIKEKNQSN